MIAAQWGPAYRLLLVIGTVIPVLAAIALAVNLGPVLLDRWRNRVEPGWEAKAARDRANAVLRAEGYR